DTFLYFFIKASNDSLSLYFLRISLLSVVLKIVSLIFLKVYVLCIYIRELFTIANESLFNVANCKDMYPPAEDPKYITSFDFTCHNFCILIRISLISNV